MPIWMSFLIVTIWVSSAYCILRKDSFPPSPFKDLVLFTIGFLFRVVESVLPLKSFSWGLKMSLSCRNRVSFLLNAPWIAPWCSIPLPSASFALISTRSATETQEQGIFLVALVHQHMYQILHILPSQFVLAPFLLDRWRHPVSIVRGLNWDIGSEESPFISSSLILNPWSKVSWSSWLSTWTN